MGFMARRTPKNRSPQVAGNTAAGPSGRRAVAQQPAPQSGGDWRPLALAVALGLVTLVLYWPATHQGFIDFDDPLYVTQNPHIRAGLNWDTWSWAWTSLEEANWHPLAWISHALDASLYGVEPAGAWGHHLTSLLLHAVNAALALLVLRSYTGRLWPSALVAALYAWHPLRVESVVWVSERKDVLCALFFWLTLAAYRHYTRRSDSWGRWLLVALAFAAGLAAKPMLVTLPFVLLLLDCWPLGRLSLAHAEPAAGERIPAWSGIWPRVREKLPLFALVAASSTITFVAQRQAGAVAKVGDVSLIARAENALVAYVAYLAKALWPANLAFFYPYPLQGFAGTTIAGAALLLAIITAAALWLLFTQRQPRGWFPVGWFWYLGMLVPVIGLVQVGSQSMADRYTYLPLVGIFVVFAWSLTGLAGRWPQALPVLGALVGLLLVACLLTTRTQIGYWNDRITLYRHAIAVTEGNYTAHSNLGHALFEQAMAGQDRQGLEIAAEEFRQALAINPRLAQAHDGLAGVHSATGDYAAAIREYRLAHGLAPKEPKPANNLAWLLATCPEARHRDPAEAVQLAELACAGTNQRDPTMLDTLAAAFAAAGRYQDAVQTAERAIELARQQRQSALENSIDQRRQLYRRGQAYVEPAAL